MGLPQRPSGRQFTLSFANTATGLTYTDTTTDGAYEVALPAGTYDVSIAGCSPYYCTFDDTWPAGECIEIAP